MCKSSDAGVCNALTMCKLPIYGWTWPITDTAKWHGIGRNITMCLGRDHVLKFADFKGKALTKGAKNGTL